MVLIRDLVPLLDVVLGGHLSKLLDRSKLSRNIITTPHKNVRQRYPYRLDNTGCLLTLWLSSTPPDAVVSLETLGLQLDRLYKLALWIRRVSNSSAAQHSMPNLGSPRTA